MTDPSGGPAELPGLHERPPWGEGGAALLEELAAVARRSGWRETARTALRAKTFAARHVLAHAATDGRADYRAILARVRTDEGEPWEPFETAWDPQWLVALGWVVGLQHLEPDDELVGARLLSLAHAAAGWAPFDRWTRLVFLQLLISCGQWDTARRLLAESEAGNDPDLPFLRLDTRHPLVHGSPGEEPVDFTTWLRELNGVLASLGSEPVGLAADGRTPFDRLRGQAPARSVEGPLVSVVMTCFRPDEALITALRSVLDQTWANLEVLLVDDASPPPFDEILDRCAQMDSRVRLIRQPVNGGTYIARNAGLEAARGAYIAGQDSDDWSHPRRLEWQIAPLLADPAVHAVQGTSIRADEYLRFNFPGYAPTRLALSTLMFRRDVVETIGYWDPVRKSADTEFLERIRLTSPRAAVDLKTPLLFARLVPTSLSRAEYTGGWAHEARRDYLTMYSHWHRRIKAGTAVLERPLSPAIRTFPAPARFLRDVPGRPQPRTEYDVIVAGGWRHGGASVRSVVDEVNALVEAGHRVGLAQLEDFRNLSFYRPAMPTPILDLVADGRADLIQFDQGASADVLIVRSPGVLVCPPSTPVSLKAGRVILLANAAPAARDGTRVRYTVEACDEAATEMFGRRPVWVPQSPTIRAVLQPLVDPTRLAATDLPCVVDVDQWWARHGRPYGERPVIGRMSADVDEKWPTVAREIVDAYPSDGEFDVRIRGGCRTASRVLKGPVPLSWLDVADDETAPRVFLSALHFFVHFDNPNTIESVGREILEALAAGCVAVLPDRFRPVYGSAALYTEPAGVRDLVRTMWRDPDAYRRQAEHGREAVRRTFGPGSYVAALHRIVRGD